MKQNKLTQKRKDKIKNRLTDVLEVPGRAYSAEYVIYDRFHKKSDRIYRFTISDPSFIAGKHFARVNRTEYIPKMAEYFPEVENYVRLAPIRGGVMEYNKEYVLVNPVGRILTQPGQVN